MIERELSAILKRFATLYPVICVTGPRQSGKTTLVKHIFSHLPYVSLENLDTRLIAKQDPRAFLKQYYQGAIFDEIQQAPELFSYMQQLVDESEQVGRYVLTGSQHFALSGSISQTLSGRVGVTTLLPLSMAELSGRDDSMQYVFQGGYPRLYKMGMHPLDFYPGYVETYLERDVRQLKQIENLDKFQIFIKLCAGRIGQTLNFSALAQDCGISHTTARTWLTILQASYIIILFQPFYKNYNKRLIRMPKMYFYDVGLACNLLGLEQKSQLETHYMRGILFENLVVLELLKGRLNQALPTNMYFWRDRTGHEVDIVAEWGGKLKAVEIKMGATFKPEFISNLSYFSVFAQEAEKYLIYQGEQEGKILDVTLTPVKKVRSFIF